MLGKAKKLSWALGPLLANCDEDRAMMHVLHDWQVGLSDRYFAVYAYCLMY